MRGGAGDTAGMWAGRPWALMCIVMVMRVMTLVMMKMVMVIKQHPENLT